MNLRVIGSLIVAAAMCCRGGFADELPGVAVWTSGEGDYHTYRIPAVIRTQEGSLLAFCEGRVSGRGDAGNIDLLLKRSDDGGKTWGDQSVLWNDTENTCGNPCPVVDESTGTIWLLLTHNLGSDTEDKIKRRSAQSTRTVWVCSSTDDGRTWTEPKNITSTTKDPLWGWYATGPGVGIQVRRGPHAGRLIIPCDHSYDNERSGNKQDGKAGENPWLYGSHVIFSDDHGATWQTGGTIRPHANECQMVELVGADPPGTLVLNARSYFGHSCRIESTSTDGGETWSDPQEIAELVEPVCQASLIRHGWPSDERAGLLLFSNPADGKQRVRLTVKSRTEDNPHWRTVSVLHEGPSAYSCLVSLNDKEAGCLFEAGLKSAYESIRFVTFAVTAGPTN